MRQELHPVSMNFRACDQPKITQEFWYQIWVRKGAPYTEKLTLEFWLPIKEAPSGGWTQNLRMVFSSQEGENFVVKAKAGGYGYCKASQAFYEAWRKMFPDSSIENVAGCGMSEVTRFLEGLGFEKV